VKIIAGIAGAHLLVISGVVRAPLHVMALGTDLRHVVFVTALHLEAIEITGGLNEDGGGQIKAHLGEALDI